MHRKTALLKEVSPIPENKGMSCNNRPCETPPSSSRIPRRADGSRESDTVGDVQQTGTILLLAPKKRIKTHTKRTLSDSTTGDKVTAYSQTHSIRWNHKSSKQHRDEISIASLNATNVKINLNDCSILAKQHKFILFQEDWLYGVKASILQKLFDNSNYHHVKCADDLAPISLQGLQEDMKTQSSRGIRR